MPLISLVVPAHNEETCLPSLFREISKVALSMQHTHTDLTFEVLVVDDGSTDGTVSYLRQFAETPPHGLLSA